MSGRYISVALRDKVVQRAGGRCEYCKSLRSNAIHAFHIDHIIPSGSGGSSDSDNLALSCGGCNSAKGNRMSGTDPVSGIDTPLFHPRKQLWQDHFHWSGDLLEVVGISPIGRATVEQLRLNREGLVNMRRLTLMSGDHPPG